MKLAQPCGIADIGLASRHVLGVTRIDQNDLKPALLENLVGRDPIDPGGFHRDTGHAARFEPVRQIMQVLRECAERTHRHVSAGRVHRSHVHLGSDVDGGGPDVDRLQFRAVTGYCVLGIVILRPILGRRVWVMPIVIFLIGIAAGTASPLSSSHAPMDHVF